MGRRDDILTVAARMFREKGYVATSLDDIAQAIGISKPGIYHYFSAKEEILYDICLMGLQHINDYVQKILYSNLDVLEKFKKIIEGHIKSYSEYRDIAGVFLGEQANLTEDKRALLMSLGKNYEAVVKGLLKQAIDEGVFRSVDADLMVHAISGMCNWVDKWYHPDGRKDINIISSEFIDLILYGLVKAPHRKEL